MLRIDHKNYIKAGIEFVDGKYNLSAVVTHNTSDWSVITLEKPVPYVWIKAVRRLDAVEIFYSFDDKEYTMMRNAWMQDNHPIMVGMMAASPDGKGFKVKFEEFSIRHLPDMRRLQWLEKNK
jgi:regulation of enolase protein 1 (concanavalin A-like superfamily)